MESSKEIHETMILETKMSKKKKIHVLAENC